MARGQRKDSTTNLQKQLKLVQDTTVELGKMLGVYDTMFNTVNKLSEGLKGTASIQEKMLKGQNASKQIDDGLLKNKAKMQALVKKVQSFKKTGLKYDLEEAMNSRKKLQAEKLILLEQEKQNKSTKQQIKNAAASMSQRAAGYAGQISLLATIYKGVLQIDKIQTQYNKSFGFSNDLADQFGDRMMDIAQSSGRVSITFLTLNKTIAGIAEATGLFAGTLRDDVLEEASELSKLMGISNKGMANLALNAQRTGQNMEDQSIEMVKGIMAGEKMMGVTVDMGAAFKAASETTGMIRANLGRSYGEIAKVTAQAQALGLTLQDLAGISKNMLNFQQSIENELTAELFIGKQLNLEKARLYSLTGDYDNLQKEIVKNIGTEYDFLKLNVLQKEKYAAAMGMSVDQMSNLVMKNAELGEIERQARAEGAEDVLEMLKQRNLQQEMADLVEKIQTTFVKIAKGPIGTIADIMSKVANSSFAVYSIMAGLAGLKMIGLITQIAALAATNAAAGASAASVLGFMTVGAGLAIAIPLIIGAIGLIGNETNKAASKVKVKRYQNLGDEEMVTLEKGSAMFDQGESVVRTENFGKLNDTLSRVENILTNQKLEVYTESHHGTRYR